VDYLYSLYDALVSINVPNDKARAVVDAMERDMGTTIATKSDLELLKAGLQGELQALRQETRGELQLIRQDMATRSDVADVRQECALIRKDLELQSNKMMIRLGSMLVVAIGLLFAGLRLGL